MKLNVRISLILIGFTLTVVLLFGGAYFVFERKAALNAQRQEEAKAADKAAEVCRSIRLTANAITALNYVQVLKKEPAILFAACVDAQGSILVHSDPRMIGQPWAEPAGGHAEVLDVPVVFGGQSAGRAIVGYDRALLDQMVRSRLWETFQRLLVVAALTFFLALILSLVLAWSLSKPIGMLAGAAREIGEGRLDYQTPIAERNDELGSLAKEMNSMARRLKELDELKDQFVSIVSHDLRSPMATITMYADFLLSADEAENKLTEQHRGIIFIMKDSATRLAVFVTNILDAAKIKAGSMTYRLEPTALDPIIRNVAGLFSIVAHQHQIEFTAQAEPGLPLVMADAERLEHALMNLLSNAFKFTASGGKIMLAARRAGAKVEIAVSDTGQGIDPEDLPRLFKPFFQPDAAAHNRKRLHGTGLGLYIVKQSVEGMKGTIEVESRAGKGSRFTIRIPAASGQ